MDRRALIDPSHAQAPPLATATVGALVAFAPPTVEAIYRVIGAVAVIAGVTISVIRFWWDLQDRRELVRERRGRRNVERDQPDRRSPP